MCVHVCMCTYTYGGHSRYQLFSCYSGVEMCATMSCFLHEYQRFKFSFSGFFNKHYNDWVISLPRDCLLSTWSSSGVVAIHVLPHLPFIDFCLLKAMMPILSWKRKEINPVCRGRVMGWHQLPMCLRRQKHVATSQWLYFWQRVFFPWVGS